MNFLCNLTLDGQSLGVPIRGSPPSRLSISRRRLHKRYCLVLADRQQCLLASSNCHRPSAVRPPSALPSPASGIWMIYARIRAAVQQQESIIAQETRLFKTLVAVAPPYRRTRLIFRPRPAAILICAFNPSTAHRTLACAEPGHSRGLQVEIPSVNDAASAVDTTSQRRIPCSQTSELRLRFRPRGRRYAATRRRCA